MTEKLKIIIKEEMAKLPKATQDAINSVNWVKITEEIGEKYLFNESQTTNFQVETMLVLVSLEDGSLYQKNLEKNVNIDIEKSDQITKEAYQKIFAPINNFFRENVKKNLKNKNPDWKQSLNFVLSGGDYSTFLEQRDDTINATPPRPDKGEVGRGF